MSGDPPGRPAGVLDTAAHIGEVLVHSLPTPFLVLVLLNCGFLSVLMLFLDRRQEATATTINKIIDACMQQHGMK